jgi:hypothetical protein
MALGGGALAGWLYEQSLRSLVWVIALSQLVALVLLALTLTGLPRRPRAAERSSS